jgi:hypothetical protein
VHCVTRQRFEQLLIITLVAAACMGDFTTNKLSSDGSRQERVVVQLRVQLLLLLLLLLLHQR